VDNTAAIVTVAREAWNDDHSKFELCCAVERALIAHAVEAVDV